MFVGKQQSTKSSSATREPNSAKSNLKKITIQQMVQPNKVKKFNPASIKSNGRASATASYNCKLIDMSVTSGVSHSNDNSISFATNLPAKSFGPYDYQSYKSPNNSSNRLDSNSANREKAKQNPSSRRRRPTKVKQRKSSPNLQMIQKQKRAGSSLATYTTSAKKGKKRDMMERMNNTVCESKGTKRIKTVGPNIDWQWNLLDNMSSS